MKIHQVLVLLTFRNDNELVNNVANWRDLLEEGAYLNARLDWTQDTTNHIDWCLGFPTYN